VIILINFCKRFHFSFPVFYTTASGVARVLKAPVQRHMMGPLVIKELSNSFAARNGRSQCIMVVRI